MSGYRVEEEYRDNGDGTLRHRLHYFGDTLHRLDGPAVEHFYEDGTVLCLEWFLHNKRCRLDGPAVEHFRSNGILYCCEWWVNDRLHRLDGPAAEWFDESGKRIAAEYWLNNEELTEVEHRRCVTLHKLAVQTIGSEGVSL